jgi:hypothetical protein
LWDVLDALAGQIRNVYESADDVPVQVEVGQVANPTPPTVDVYPAPLSRDPETAAFGDLLGGYLLTVRARINTNDNDATRRLLIDMMDDQHDLSLLAAVCDDETLNGNAASVDPRDHTGENLYQDVDGKLAYRGFEFAVLVIPGES